MGLTGTGKALGFDGEALKTFVESKETDRIMREEKKDKKGLKEKIERKLRDWLVRRRKR